jgi:hypothetical protein
MSNFKHQKFLNSIREYVFKYANAVWNWAFSLIKLESKNYNAEYCDASIEEDKSVWIRKIPLIPYKVNENI